MSLPYSLAPQIGTAGRLGLIVLQSDETMEAELRGALPTGDIAAFVSRISSAAEVSSESLAKMEMDLPCAAGLLPKSVAFDVVGYGCTSASSVIGTERIADLVRAECQTSAVTDPVSALVAVCKEFGVSKLALLTPYTEEVSDSLRATLMQNGIETPVFGTFNEPVETNVARIDPASIRDAAIKMGADKGAEAVFMSCTNLRTFGILKDVKEACAKPALSSNQALFWHMFKLAGLSSDLLS
ncbi:maleate cis-trans isomerase family protein [Planktotalea sp.]|uniref:maleate cis-trans isomerase family protein n=1 Tax=Planktotalea sp. TaxID=2029877 RepID=UPI003D6C5FB4